MNFFWLIIAFLIGGILTLINNKKKFNSNFYKSLSLEQLKEETLNILNNISNKHNEGSDFIYSGFEDLDDFRTTIEKYNFGIKHNDILIIEKLSSEFLPTVSFQELSIQNGWSEEYIILSNKFDLIYPELIQKLKNIK